MKKENQSSHLDFILLGVTGQHEQNNVFFVIFLCIYPISLTGNLLIILAIQADIRLHNPMYFFLVNLSLVDIFSSSVSIPKILVNHLLGSKSISFGGCLTQMYFMIALANADSYTLAAMAYDRAVAISRPLHYTAIMSPRSCVLLVVGSWVIGNANGLPHTLLTASLSFCGNQEVANFYCDITPLLKLSCSDIRFNVKMMYVGSAFSLCHCYASLSPMFESSPQSSRFLPPRVYLKPSPPVAPTSRLFFYIMVQRWACICAL